MTRLKIGDIVEIPLSTGHRAFCQYVYRDKMGPIVRVFDLILEQNEEITLERFQGAQLLFPPVITGLLAAVRTGLWKVIGRLPVLDFQYPNFISSLYNSQTGKYGNWYLWNGSEDILIGSELPPAYHHLERLVVWHPLSLAERIETGDNPYAYPRHGV